MSTTPSASAVLWGGAASPNARDAPTLARGHVQTSRRLVRAVRPGGRRSRPPGRRPGRSCSNGANSGARRPAAAPATSPSRISMLCQTSRTPRPVASRITTVVSVPVRYVVDMPLTPKRCTVLLWIPSATAVLSRSASATPGPGVRPGHPPAGGVAGHEDELDRECDGHRPRPDPVALPGRSRQPGAQSRAGAEGEDGETGGGGAVRRRAELAATPSSTMFPVMTLVKAPPRASRPIASVAPLTTARVTTRVWRSRCTRRSWSSAGASAPAAGGVGADVCTEAGSRPHRDGGPGPCAHGIRSALCRMTLGWGRGAHLAWGHRPRADASTGKGRP